MPLCPIMCMWGIWALPNPRALCHGNFPILYVPTFPSKYLLFYQTRKNRGVVHILSLFLCFLCKCLQILFFQTSISIFDNLLLRVKSPNLGGINSLAMSSMSLSKWHLEYWNSHLRYHMCYYFMYKFPLVTNITCSSIHWSMWHLLGEALN
jgi:hypothetical protein